MDPYVSGKSPIPHGTGAGLNWTGFIPGSEHQGSLSYSNAIRGHITVRHRVSELKFTCSVNGPSAAFLQLPVAPPAGSVRPEDAGPREEVFLKATLHSPDPSLRLSVDTCVASPDPHDFATVKYDLIQQGRSDSPVLPVNPPGAGPSHQVRLRRHLRQPPLSPEEHGPVQVQRLQLPPRYEVVYLQCEVAVCRAGDPSSRCSQGCDGRGRSRRGAGPVVATGEQAGHLRVLGPLEIRRGTDRVKVGA
ncbi:hypothetical protein QTO34_005739 [Cnephaeus nilssonii]|uniref:ZP domain-containing protein n=1 Tax=Cnephaeus nilssonii TaxID=3371016 RepID=A0AA40HLD0_CNENI|nr:hypothetical protein QTO34_005739 [Eptesicus nilssonii]